MGYRGADVRTTVTTSDKSEGLVKKSVSSRIEVFGEGFFFLRELVSRDGTLQKGVSFHDSLGRRQ